MNNKTLAAIGGGVLIVALIVIVIIFAVQTNGLNAELENARQQAASLQTQVAGLQTNTTTLQSQLTDVQSRVTSLQSELSTASGQISTLRREAETNQSTIGTQAAQIKTMRYPRHFTAIDELTNWLQKDDTNSLYPTPTAIQKAQMAFILEVKAARDGFLLPVSLPPAGNLDLLTNRAIVGDFVYDIRAWDDFAQIGGRVSPAMPSYPIVPESNQ